MAQNLVVRLSREQTYRYLFELCQNEKLFTIIDYGENWQDEDFERIVISNAEAIRDGEQRAVIGTVRLLPYDNGTTVMFVNKDAIWHRDIPESDEKLFQRFIKRATDQFKDLNLLVKRSRNNDTMSEISWNSVDRAIKLLNTPRNYPDYIAFKIKPIPSGDCDLYHWPKTWDVVNEYIYPYGPIENEGDALIGRNNNQFVLECHESGPEIVVFLGIVVTLGLIRSIVDLITEILRAHQKEEGTIKYKLITFGNGIMTQEVEVVLSTGDIANQVKRYIESSIAMKRDTIIIESLYINTTRIEQLRNIKSDRFDLTKLIRLCEEANICYSNECYFALAMITRAIIDHVPPLLGLNTFKEIESNYSGTRSFKEQMEHLHNSLRKIADSFLHTIIRNKETLPNLTQVNFSNDIDVLLAEIVRGLK